MNIFPRLGEHMAIIGMTGSGKTTAATVILSTGMRAQIPVAILDTKGEKEFSPLRPHTRLAKITRDDDIICYRPEADELGGPGRPFLQRFLQLAYHRPRSGMVYIDELSSLGATDQTPGEGLLTLLARGREHIEQGRVVHTTTICATQRPLRIPRQALTEATHILCFALTDKKDRERVAECTHPALLVEAPWHSFWYWRRGQSAPRLTQFNLSGKSKAAQA